MLKALLKKQLLEFVSGFILKGNGQKNGKSSKSAMIILFGFVFVSFMFMFFSMAYMMSELIFSGYSWLYFSVFGTLATLMGIFGSVFMTYNALYEAKDNDLLLSMPIPSGMILFSRMAGLYISAFFFETLVSLPVFIVYLINAPFNIPSLLFSLLNLFVLPLFALSVSCVLGWFIAFFASKIRNKSIITVAFSVVFFAVYYFCAIRLNRIINLIITNSEEIGEWIKKFLYPLYKMGQGCAGDVISYIAFLLFISVLFGVIYKILSVSFIKLATTKRGMKKTLYKEKTAKKASAKTACFRKELLYFKNTPVYMLNCGLGSLIMIVVAVLAAVKKDSIAEIFSVAEQIPLSSMPFVLGLGLCFMSSMNNITSVSISLEGKTLWLLKSVPLDIKDIIFGKLMLHISVTGIPLFIADVIILCAVKADLLNSFLIIIFSQIFMILCAFSGLMANFIFPKLDWTNETVPIKQSISSMVGMFSGLLFTIVIILSLFFTSAFVPFSVFIITATLIIIMLICLIYRWLITKGQEKFKQM